MQQASAMGFLGKDRDGGGEYSGAAVVFWLCAGLISGLILSGELGLVSPFGPAVVLLGTLLGAAIGAYAGFGTTKLARALALPGAAIELLSWWW